MSSEEVAAPAEAGGSFYVSKSETLMDTVFSTEPMMALYPDIYGPRLDAVAELRALDDGSLHRGSEFRRIASFTNVPLFNTVNTLFEPDFMKDKKKFYAFLRRNKEYCTYDIRRHAIGQSNTVTYVDGQAV